MANLAITYEYSMLLFISYGPNICCVRMHMCIICQLNARLCTFAHGIKICAKLYAQCAYLKIICTTTSAYIYRFCFGTKELFYCGLFIEVKFFGLGKIENTTKYIIYAQLLYYYFLVCVFF